jgi:hypothetical protein
MLRSRQENFGPSVPQVDVNAAAMLIQCANQHRAHTGISRNRYCPLNCILKQRGSKSLAFANQRGDFLAGGIGHRFQEHSRGTLLSVHYLPRGVVCYAFA